MEAWVRATVDLLVCDLDAVEIEFIEGSTVSVISVTVAPDDVGKIIGKQGTIADGLRTLLNGFGGREKTKYVLHIVA